LGGAKNIHRFSNGVCALLEKVGVAEGIVATDAHDQMRCISRQRPQLTGDAERDVTIDGEESRTPIRRQLLPELGHDIRPTGDIRRVVEDGIPEENDVTSRHGWDAHAANVATLPAGAYRTTAAWCAASAVVT
jgi:hypothetical protein